MALFEGTNGLDIFNGTGAGDTFRFQGGELQGGDLVAGNGGVDTLDMRDQAAFVLNGANLANVSGIEVIDLNLHNAFGCVLILPNALVASSGGVDGYSMTIQGGSGGDQFDLTNVNAGYSLFVDSYDGNDAINGGAADGTYVWGAGNDLLTAGLGIEVFGEYGPNGGNIDVGETDSDRVEGTAAAVDGDTYISGRAWAGESVTVTTAGTFRFTMDEFETVNLAGGGNFATIDLITYGASITLNGGSGNDNVTFNAPVIVEGNFGLRLFGFGGSDTLEGLLTNDRLEGGASGDILRGALGNDKLYGGATADILYGGGDNDSLYGGEGVDTMYGGEGNDKFYGGVDADIMNGGLGDDRYFAVTEADVVGEHADGGHDTVETGGAVFDMAAQVEDLKYTGAGGTDITGNGAGNTIWTGAQGDTVNGAAGEDIVYGGGGDDTLEGQNESDELYGGAGMDILDGGYGDDWLQGGGGNDTLRGGQGFDTADFSNAVGALDIDMGRSDEVITANSVEQLASIERIYGGDFDDVFASSDASIVMYGGLGFDTLDYRQATESINLSWGVAERIIGGSADDFISGKVCEGRDGNDHFYGGVHVEQDAQTFDGGDDDGFGDTAYYSVNQVAGETQVDLMDSANNHGAALGDILIGIENLVGSDVADDYFYGNDQDNNIRAYDGLNAIGGRGGDDTLLGGADFDQIAGGEGDDIIYGYGFGDFLYGDEGSDTVSYYGSAAGVTVELINANGIIVADGVGGDAEDDYLENVENLIGSTFDDILSGEDGKNVLDGGNGNDTLTGGKGQDTLTGVGGIDTFVFKSVKDSKVGSKHDTVTDFMQLQGDLIDLSAIDAVKGGGDNAFHFTANQGTDAFTGDAGELRFFDDGTDTYVQGDVDGDGSADFEIALTGVIALTAADFVA